LQRELRASFLATTPPSAIITTAPFDDELVEAARGVPGVAGAQGRRAVPARIQVGPDAWQEAVLYVLPDDGAMEVSIVRPYAGAWPPPDHAVLIERASTARARATLGDTLHIALPGQHTRELPVAATPLDGLIGRLTFLGRPTRLALRNTFRRRARLARTVFALALGGAVFLAAMTLRLSLFATLDASIASQHYDIEIQFSRPYRAERIASVVASAPGVTGVESLLRATACPVRADGNTGEAMAVRAMPADTTMYAPRMAEGRWLHPGDTQAVVLSTNIMYKEPGIRVGDPIRLEINGKTSTFQVVGLIEEIMLPVNPVWVYMTLDGYTATQGGAGRSDTLRVATSHDAAGHAAMVAALERRLAEAGFDVRIIHSRSEDRAILAERFNFVTPSGGAEALSEAKGRGLAAQRNGRFIRAMLLAVETAPRGVCAGRRPVPMLPRPRRRVAGRRPAVGEDIARIIVVYRIQFLILISSL
jgi:hypothetical protein